MGGVQFIPSRLPSGEFALVMPNSANGGGRGGINDVGGGGGDGGGGGSSGINSGRNTPDHWKPYYPMESLSLHQSSALDLNDTAITRSAFSNVTKRYLADTSPLSPVSSMSSGIDDSSSSINQTDFQTTTDTSSPQRTPQKLNLSAFPTPPSGGSISLIPTTHHSGLASLTTATTAAATPTAATLQQPHVTSTTEQQATQKLRPISLELHLRDGDTEPMEYRECSSDGSDNNNTNKKRPKSNQSPPIKDNDKSGSVAATTTASIGGNKSNDDNDIDDDNLDVDTESSPPPLKCTKSEPKDYSINSDESNNNNDDDDDQSEKCSGDMWRPW